MSTAAPLSPIHYPESDGTPLADNTKQFEWIFVLFGNLAAMFPEPRNVFVGGNLFWYPVEGHPEIVQAPDVFVVFGRPRGHRRSYQQWEEDDVPFTVVFEILSPKNTVDEMNEKFAFYEDYGVEEYYVYNPDTNRLVIYVRHGEVLRRVRPAQGFVSPRLGIRFDLSGPEMVVYGPDGEWFLSYEQLKKAHEEVNRRVAEASRAADEARGRAARLAELGRKARRGQATAEELQELERLEEESTGGAP